MIYGINDMAIDVISVDNSEKFFKGRYRIEKLNSGHWLIQESFKEVSKSIIEHINYPLLLWEQGVAGSNPVTSTKD